MFDFLQHTYTHRHTDTDTDTHARTHARTHTHTHVCILLPVYIYSIHVKVLPTSLKMEPTHAWYRHLVLKGNVNHFIDHCCDKKLFVSITCNVVSLQVSEGCTAGLIQSFLMI